MTDSTNSTQPIKKQEGVGSPTSIPNSKRPPQTIRGGFIVVRRNSGNGSLKRIAFNPFEHGDIDEARKQAAVLAAREGGEFSVFCQVATILPQDVQRDPETPLQPPAVPEPVEPPQRRPVVVERRNSRARPQGGRA